VKCDAARQGACLGRTRLGCWLASAHLHLCPRCRQWQKEQRATEALLQSLPPHPLPAGLQHALRQAICKQEKVEKAREPGEDAGAMIVLREGSERSIGGRNYRRRLAWAALGVIAVSLALAGLHLLRNRTDQAGRETAAQPAVPAIHAQLILPKDFDTGAPFLGKVIALVEPEEKALLPELRPLEEALAHMLLSDLAADLRVRVVSRERVSQTLAEVQMGEAALTEPETTQHLGKAIEADTLVSIKVAGNPSEIGAALQLLSPETGEPAWSKKFSGSPDNLLALEKEMLAALRARLGLKEPAAGETRRGELATLAIFDFQPAGPATELDKHAGDLADLLSSFLSTDENVRLIERERLAAVLEEKELILTQRSAASQAWLASMLGAQRFLYTTMVQWRSEVRFDAHLVEPESGLIIGALSAQGRIDRTPALLKELARQIAAKFSARGELPTAPPSVSGDTLPLEAAIHYARGYRSARRTDYEQARAEFEKAALLAPHDREVWWQLVNACYFGRQYDAAARYAKTFVARNPKVAGYVNYKLTEAERARRNLAGMEAAARAMLNDPNFTEPWKVGAASEQLLWSLVWQSRWEEALRYCKELRGKTDTENLSRAWSWLLGSLSYQVLWLREQGNMEPSPGSLEILRQAVEAIPANEPMLDQRVGHELSWLLLAHCVGSRVPEEDFYKGPARDLSEGLKIAERAAEKFKSGNRLPAMANVARGLILARMERHEEALKALRGVLQKYPKADVDNADYISFTPPANGTVHFYIGLINEHIHNRAAAASAYREAVRLLNPNQNRSGYLIDKLEGWQEPLPVEAVREKRVEGYPPLEWGHGGLRLVDWLRMHDYQLWGMAHAYNTHFCSGVVGTLVIIYDGEIPWGLDPEDLRAWVAHGGRLLLLNRTIGHETWGETVLASDLTRDQTLNWVLYPFGIAMDPSRTWSSAEAKPEQVVPTGHPMTQGLKPFAYSGDWWPLICPEKMAALRLAKENSPASDNNSAERGPVVAAATQLGLGRVAVVTLREWFPSGSYEGWRSPAPWEEALLAHVMGWLTEPEADPQRRQLADRFIAPWQTYTEVGPLDSIEQFRSLEKLPGLPGEEVRYLVARLLCSSGSSQEALPRFRDLARSASDPSLRRAAALWLCRLYGEANEPREAQEYYRLAASVHGDKLWAKATIQLGDLSVQREDFKKAEERFREVASVTRYSEERIRAIFGLAYTLERQGRLGEAARLYQALKKQYGYAMMPPSLDQAWPDPWQLYWPQAERPQDSSASASDWYRVQAPVQYRLKVIKQAQTGKGKGEKASTGGRAALWRFLFGPPRSPRSNEAH